MRGKTSKAHLHAFLTRVDRAKLRRTISERHFWEKADPEIDAWMLATGRLRDIFDVNLFVQMNPEITGSLARLRKILNVRILSDRCPVQRALKTKEHGRDDNPSPSLWSTVKSWISK